MAGKTGVQFQHASNNGEDLKHGARGEQEVEVAVLQGDGAEDELMQPGEGGTAREGGGVDEPPCAEVQAAEGGAAEESGGEAQAFEGRGAVDEDELLDALGGEELEPAREHGAVPVDGLHEPAGEADERERPGVRAEGCGDGAAHGARDGAGARGPALGAAAGEEVGVDEDERRRAPDAGPALGERGGSRGVPGREAATATGPREGGGVPGGMQPRRRAVEGLSRRGAVLRRQGGGGE